MEGMVIGITGYVYGLRGKIDVVHACIRVDVETRLDHRWSGAFGAGNGH
jgi:hypothetical protein